MSATLLCNERGDAVRVTVQVKPRASRSEIIGVRDDGALAVALLSPPVDGAANKELIDLFAKSLSIRKRDVTIASGERGRRKLIDLAGVTAARVRSLLS